MLCGLIRSASGALQCMFLRTKKNIYAFRLIFFYLNFNGQVNTVKVVWILCRQCRFWLG